MTTPDPIELVVTDNASALLRHFADLRDGTHGEAHSRADKEALFSATAALMDSPCRLALAELNESLLLNTGTIHNTGVTRTPDSGLGCSWTLSWPRQVAAEIPPITLTAYFGRNFHHPHLRGGTVRDWPLNVFTPRQATGELPTLRAIAAAELHNLVFLADFRIVPATGPAEAVSPW